MAVYTARSTDRARIADESMHIPKLSTTLRD